MKILSRANADWVKIIILKSTKRDTHTHTHTDDNECYLQRSGCQHRCTNTIGSYVCSCHDGFRLANDEHTCTPGEPLVYIVRAGMHDTGK